MARFEVSKGAASELLTTHVLHEIWRGSLAGEQRVECALYS